mgnify:FL=1
MSKENKETKELPTFEDEYNQFANQEKLTDEQIKNNLSIFNQAITLGKAETRARNTIRNVTDKQTTLALQMVEIFYPFIEFLGYVPQSNNTNNPKVNKTNKEVISKLKHYGLTINQINDLLRKCKQVKAVATKIGKSDPTTDFDQVMNALQNNDDVLDSDLKPEKTAKDFSTACDTLLGNAEKIKATKLKNQKTADTFLDTKNKSNIASYIIGNVVKFKYKALKTACKREGYTLMTDKELKELLDKIKDATDPIEYKKAS